MKKLVVFLVGFSLLFFGVQPANAIGMVDVSEVNLSKSKGLTFNEGLFSATPDQACFYFDGGYSVERVYRNMTLTKTSASGSVSSTLDDGDAWGTDAQICFYSSAGSANENLGDLSDYTSLKLTGEIVAASTVSTANAAFAKVGLSIVAGYLFTWGGKAHLELNIKNKTKKNATYQLSGLKLGGVKLSDTVGSIVLAPGASYPLQIGSLPASYGYGYQDLKLTATLKKAPEALFNKSVKLPKGVVIDANPVKDWWFVEPNTYSSMGNHTYICLNLRNTTSAPITLKSELKWKVRNTKVNLLGSSVETIPAKSSKCVTGVWLDRMPVLGDARLAVTTAVSGTITKVSKYKLNLAGLTLPSGWAVDPKTSFTYNSNGKSTSLMLWLKFSGQDTGRDVVARQVRVNGKLTNIDPGTGPIQASDSAGYRRMVIATLPGDKRYAATWTITGVVSESLSVQGIMNDFTNVSDDINCQPNYPWEWVYSPVDTETKITFYCRNATKNTVTLDISNLVLSAGLTEDNMVDYHPPLAGRYVKLIPSKNYHLVTFFWIPGDVRTGGYSYVFNGSIVLK